LVLLAISCVAFAPAPFPRSRDPDRAKTRLVTITDALIGSSVRPDSRVDVLHAHRYADSAATTLLRDVRVAAVDTRKVTLVVTPAQAKVLRRAGEEGQFMLVPRAQTVDPW
jgi:Flp pilus assembly protein CpaB